MAAASLRKCQGLFRAGAAGLYGKNTSCFSLGFAPSSALRPSNQLRYRNDSATAPNPIQNPKVGTEGFSVSREGVASYSHLRSSINDAEVVKFAAIADTWWDFEGPFKPLHLMNPTRVSFVRSSLCRHFRRDPRSIRPFEGLNIIDVGCGGGILSESLARMGASVTGLDVVEANINVSRIHAAMDPLTSSIEYICSTAVSLSQAFHIAVVKTALDCFVAISGSLIGIMI